jgi:hypothetical protein
MKTRYYIPTAVALLLVIGSSDADAQQPRGPSRGARGGTQADSPLIGGRGRGRGSQAGTTPITVEQLQKQVDDVEAKLKAADEKREIKFSKADVQKEKLTSPKLFDQKHMARIVLRASGESAVLGQRLDYLYSIVNDIPRPLLPAFGHGNGLYYYGGGFGGGGGVFGQPGAFNPREFLKALIDACPADKRPPQAMVEYLASDAVGREIRLEITRRIAENVQLNVSEWQLTLFAPTAADAEARARAIVELLDNGFSRPVRRLLVAKANQAIADGKESLAVAEVAAMELSAAQELRNKPTDAPSEIIADLRAQRVSVAVELAGLSARIKACDEMLNKPERLPPDTLRSVSDVKVRSEIERAGVKEKLDRINAYISEGEERIKLERTLETLERKTGNADLAARRVLSSVSHYCQSAALFTPLEAEITLASIEWTE